MKIIFVFLVFLSTSAFAGEVVTIKAKNIFDTGANSKIACKKAVDDAKTSLNLQCTRLGGTLTIEKIYVDDYRGYNGGCNVDAIGNCATDF